MDDVFARKDQTVLGFLPFLVVGIFAFRGLMNFGQSYLNEYVGLKIINDVRNALNRHFQSLSLSFFHRNPTGSLISRVNSDVFLLRYSITDALASFMKDATSLVALVIVAFLKDWVLASIAFFVFPASVLPVIRLSKKVKRFTRRSQISTGMLTELLQESIQGNRIVKAFGMEKYEDRRFMQENHQLFNSARQPHQSDRGARHGAVSVFRHRWRGLVWRLERDRRRAHPRRVYGVHGGDVLDVWTVQRFD
jgi:subfamily B ATP-binding cassette protein MsbA